MNAVHVHLMANHISIMGFIFASLIFIAGWILRNSTVRKVSYVIYILAALATIPVMKSGEESEEMIENMAGVNEDFIHEHEEAAESVHWFALLLGALGLGMLRLDKAGNKQTKILLPVMLVLSLLVSTAMIRIGYLGGKIRHPEIDQNTTMTNQVQETEEDD